MATYEDFLREAAKADAAGDTEARDRLLRAAQKARAQTPQGDQGYALPVDPKTGASGPARPPAAPADAEPGYIVGEVRPQRDNFGDTIRSMTEGPLEATKYYAKGAMDPSKQPVERLKDAGMTALAGLGTASAFASGLAGEMFGGSPSNEMRLARDLSMMQEVAVPELAGVSSAARVAGSAGRKLASERPAGLTERAATAAADLGITPSLAMTGKVGAMASSLLEKTILTGARVGKDTARAAAEIEGAAKRITGMIGKTQSPYGAGKVLQSGLDAYVTRVKGRADEMYAAVAREIPPDTRMRLDITQQSMAGLKEAFKDNPELAQKLGLNQWDKVLAEAGQNGITWEAAQQFRSSIGEALGSISGPLADQSQGRLKQLYAALTADMERTAKESGDTAYAAWQKANSFYKRSAERIEKQLDGTISANSPERAFELFYSATFGDRASSDLDRLTAIKASLKPGEWRDISASIVDRLGKARPGAQNAAGDAFSPATFLTNWSKMSPEAKKLLLPEDVRIELDKLMTVTEAAKRGGLERNTSNTGNILSGVALTQGFMSAPGWTLGAAAGSALGAKALTSVPFLRMVNAAQRGDDRALKAVAAGNGPFKADAAEVLRLMAADAANISGPPENGLRIAK